MLANCNQKGEGLMKVTITKGKHFEIKKEDAYKVIGEFLKKASQTKAS
jgi:hypothetical protein